MTEKEVQTTQPSAKDYADAIRGMTDEQLIQIYNLAITQLETVALTYKASVNKNLVEKQRRDSKCQKKSLTSK